MISQPDRPAGPRPQAGAAAGGARPRAALGLPLAQPERPAEALPLLAARRGRGGRGRRLRRARAALAAGRAAVRQPASLRAAALARRRADRARADGRRARRAPSPRCCSSRRSTPARWPRSSASTSGPTTTPARSTQRALELGLRALRARARATPRAAALATVPQVGEPTYAAKITAADRVLDPRGPRASCTIACARCRRTSARGWRSTARRTRSGARACVADGPAGRACWSATATSLVLGCGDRRARAVRAAAAGRAPHAGRRLAARPARRTAGGDGRVSDARTLALRVLTRVFDEGAYADRAFSGEAERARVDARDRALAMHLAFGAVQRRRTLDAALEEIAGPPGAAAGAPPRARAAARRLPDPVRRRNPAACSGFRERRAGAPRDRRTRHRPRQRRAAAHRQRRGPAWYAALPEETPEDAALRHSLPDWIAELWFDAYGERAGAGAVRRGQPPAGAVALAEPAARRARRRSRPGCARPAPRPSATTRRASCASTGPLDVAGSEAFTSGAVVPDRPRRRPGRRSASARSPACACSTSARRRAARPPCWRRAAPA